MANDITEISRILSNRAQDVAEYLLPGGRKDGSEWRAGSIRGDKGDSLGVHLYGNKAGVWSDFATGEKGDLLELWRLARNVSLGQALDEARSWLGIQRPIPANKTTTTWVKPKKPKCSSPSGAVLDYLREERNISADALRIYRIAERGNDIIFPFLNPEGELVNYKIRPARKLTKEDPKAKPEIAGMEQILFGWQAIDPNARSVIICEGEIDALSWCTYGWGALSVPFGAQNLNWIENDFERLERFEKIYVSTDMDKPGEKCAKGIIDRLGAHRCVRVRLLRKDANECLVDGVTRDEMEAALAQSVTFDPEGLRRPTDYADHVVKLFWPPEEKPQGYTLPFKKIGAQLLFRPGEVTLWSGASGAGKSLILSHCIVDWIDQGSRVCLSSLEMKPEQSLKRMVRQTIALEKPTEKAIHECIRYLDRGLVLYDRLGKSGVDGLLDVFDFARSKYGCDQFVIDSLMRLGIQSDDYTGQEQALFKIVTWAINRSVHVHLVAHARKGEASRAGPAEGDDIKGAMEISANAANIVTVWRHKKLEEQIRNAKEDEKADLEQKPTVLLNVAKQRNGDFEGKIGLWFDLKSYQYQSSWDRSDWQRSYLKRVNTTEAL